MIKQVTVAILMIAFLAGNFTKALVIADYYLNTDAYAKNCINKARPKMNCKGQCQVMKKIREEEKKEAQQKSKIEELKNEVFSSRSSFPTLLLTVDIIDTFFYPAISNNKTCTMPRTVFHPPSFSC